MQVNQTYRNPTDGSLHVVPLVDADPENELRNLLGDSLISVEFILWDGTKVEIINEGYERVGNTLCADSCSVTIEFAE